MPYRPTYKSDIDRQLLNSMTVTDKQELSVYTDIAIWNWDSVSDLVQRTGLRIGAVRNSLKRLVEDKLALRGWQGNERYGRYVYARTLPVPSPILRF